nr:MAG TPA: hypothetical protein [Caudoviricetes sp.]
MKIRSVFNSIHFKFLDAVLIKYRALKGESRK